MARPQTVAVITLAVGLLFAGLRLVFWGPYAGNPFIQLAGTLFVVGLAGTAVGWAIWKDWFSHPLTDPPKRSHSHSLARHTRGAAGMARAFSAFTRATSLPEPPKPAGHDPQFLAAWVSGDLQACDRRLNLLAEEMERRDGPEMSRLLHYQRCLEQARKAASQAARPDLRTTSILDETE